MDSSLPRWTIALLLVVLVSAAACTPGGTDLATPVQPTPTVVPLPTSELPEAVTPTPTPSPTPTPTPTPTATPTGEAEVAAVQAQLTELGYYIGPIDGAAGPATASAVQAFQKVNGLGADGVIGPNTLAALQDPVVPTLAGGPGDRVEVDLQTQVLYLVEGGDLTRILPISSGSGETYTTADGGTARSLTPVGTFTVERRISGERHAPLGILYDPLYFHRGWAIHGSNSVPAYPASHGCVRVTRADATWLFQRVGVGMTVILYGDRNSFDPRAGESAGTTAPAGDTADTTPPDGIQTEEPSPSPAPSAPTAPPPAPAPPPPAPPPTDPAPTDPAPPAPTAPEAPPTPQPAPTTSDTTPPG